MLKLHAVGLHWFSRPLRKISAIAENHDTRTVKATMIVNTWLFYSAKKCYNWSQLRSLPRYGNFGCEALDQSNPIKYSFN